MFRAEKPNPKTSPLLGEVASQFQRAFTWMVQGFGLPTDKVPYRMWQGGVQPTAEVYRPTLRELYAPTSTDAVDGGISFTVPKDVFWELVGLSFIFTSSAVAGNREILVDVLRTSVATIVRTVAAGGNLVQAASLSFCYSFGAYGTFGPSQTAGNRRILIAAPVGLVILPGWSIKALDINGVDVAGDSYTNLCLLVKEHPGLQKASS